MPAACPSCSLPRPFSPPLLPPPSRPQLLALLVVVAGQADDCHCVFMYNQNLAADKGFRLFLELVCLSDSDACIFVIFALGELGETEPFTRGG
ncbi:hypothetical protein GE21DRAFT_1278154 [Neurospora crassa]|nr:hypothetical protein GE21DRAFT_1278154 [Neurospora crassa]